MIRRLAVLLLTAVPAWTNDSFVHQSGGNLMFVSNNQVAIQRELLVIGPPRLSEHFPWEIPFHIEYDLENVSGTLVQARIGFPLPSCSLNDYVGSKIRDFVTGSAATCVKEPPMSLEVDGKAVSGQWDYVFLRNGAPFEATPSNLGLGRKLATVIDLARLVELVPNTLDEDPAFGPALLAICTQLGGTLHERECSAFEGISLHRTFVWEYEFAPRAKAHVVHDYKVTASWNLHPEDVFSFDAFCLADPTTRTAWSKYRDDLRKGEEQWYKAQQSDYPYPREFFTEYVLHTGALWAGPIRDFELVIRKSSPAQLISTCFKGLTKTSATEFRTHRVDYKPAEDLRILYLAPAK
jgi:hypothetical protein